MTDIRRMSHCPYCATRLEEVDLGGQVRPTCNACGFRQYANPVPAVNAVVVRDGHILLVKRGHEPYAGTWALPGGFVDWDEEALDAAVREAWEETGVRIRVTGLPLTITETADPRGNTLNVNFPAEPIVPDGLPQPVAGDDAADAAWCSLEDLTPLAFPSHDATLVRMGLRRVR